MLTGVLFVLVRVSYTPYYCLVHVRYLAIVAYEVDRLAGRDTMSVCLLECITTLVLLKVRVLFLQ